MKKLILSVFLGLGTVASLLAADGDTFTWEGLNYTVLSESEKTCEVAENDTELAGAVIIPSKATNESNGNEYTVIALGQKAFYANKKMTEISIPETVKTIRYNAISQTLLLAKLVIPNTVTEIEEHAVYGNWGLTNLTLSSGVRELKRESFSGNSYLRRIVIPEGVEIIGPEVFNYCGQVAKLSISSTVKSIGKMAFSGQRSLKEVSIPASVDELGEEAFSYCVNLADVTFEESKNPIRIGINVFGQGMYFGTADDPMAKIEILSIKRPWTCASAAVNEMPFSKQPTLQYITIGANVASLPSNTFANSNEIKSITIEGNRCLSFGSGCFPDGALKNAVVTVPENMLSAYQNSGWNSFESIDGSPDLSGIDSIVTDADKQTIVGYYDLNGRRVSGNAAPGVYIIRRADGSAAKVVMSRAFNTEI